MTFCPFSFRHIIVPDHLSSTPVLVGFMFSLQCFVEVDMSCCPFSFLHGIVCPLSIYDF